MDNLESKLREIKIENFIWLIYIGIIILSYYSNYLEKDYFIPGSISSLEKKLDNRFLKCNRSYIINLEQIESYNSKTNLITLKNNEVLDAISMTKKKRIIQYMRGIDK